MQALKPAFADLILLGGGHANIQVLKMFAMKPIEHLRITLISDQIYAPYSGMLPGYLLGYYSFEQCHFDLAKLANQLNIRFINAKVIGIDSSEQKILLEDRPSLSYDYASINIGIKPTPLVKNVDKFIPIKPIGNFIKKWNLITKEILLKNESAKPYNIAIVGGGASGVEIALVLGLLNHQNKKGDIKRNIKRNIKISLYQKNSSLISENNSKTHKKILQACKKYRIKVFLNKTFDNEQSSLFDKILVTNKAKADTWFKDNNFQIDPDGFLKVDQNLNVLNFKNLFAAGDCIHYTPCPLKKAGVYAVRQGPILAHNIRTALLEKNDFKQFIPKKNVLSLLVSGPKESISHQDSFSFLSLLPSRLLWKIKNIIDLKFMENFSTFPDKIKDMPEAVDKLKSENWLENTCGGCGSKVGANVLSKVLKELNLDQLNEDAAILETNSLLLLKDNQIYDLQTIDQFRSFISDPFLFGQISVYHALSDIYAMGGMPTSLMVGVSLPLLNEKLQSRDLFQVLSGIQFALKESSTPIIGGHTSEGHQLTLSLVARGTVKKNELLKKSRLDHNEQLILTKPIGSGAILAAHMLNLTTGKILSNAITQMSISNRLAVGILKKYKITNCTDVTGFGLAGHLKEMLKKDFDAHLDYQKIPVIDGLKDIFNDGIRASISKKNELSISSILNKDISDESHPILFDPQTSGGMIFSIKKDMVKQCLIDLSLQGYVQAKVIGTIKNGTGKIYV